MAGQDVRVFERLTASVAIVLIGVVACGGSSSPASPGPGTKQNVLVINDTQSPVQAQYCADQSCGNPMKTTIKADGSWTVANSALGQGLGTLTVVTGSKHHCTLIPAAAVLGGRALSFRVSALFAAPNNVC